MVRDYRLNARETIAEKSRSTGSNFISLDGKGAIVFGSPDKWVSSEAYHQSHGSLEAYDDTAQHRAEAISQRASHVMFRTGHVLSMFHRMLYVSVSLCFCICATVVARFYCS